MSVHETYEWIIEQAGDDPDLRRAAFDAYCRVARSPFPLPARANFDNRLSIGRFIAREYQALTREEGK